MPRIFKPELYIKLNHYPKKCVTSYKDNLRAKKWPVPLNLDFPITLSLAI